MHVSTIITYGGGEVLQGILNAVAMIVNNGNGSLIKPLALLAASVGGFWVILKNFFSPNLEGLLTSFFLPVLAVVGVLMVPSKTVRIEDVIKGRSYTVNHVPLLLSGVAAVSSSVGYQLTKAIESVMHLPGGEDSAYSKTGMIFGSQAAMDVKKYRINNAELEASLQRFAKKCMLYDIALNKYSIDDVKKSTDLWKFLSENTSATRMVEVNTGELFSGKELLTCKQAMTRMKSEFDWEINRYGAILALKNLPGTLQGLTGIQQDAKKTISQQLMMNVIASEYNSEHFARDRASLQQRNTFNVMGAMAGSHLLSLRSVFEALLYGAFIFILPLMLIPGGLSIFGNWAMMVAWVQIWPPFYSILNYIVLLNARESAGHIFFGLSDANKGLSLQTVTSLSTLHEDAYAMAGYMSVMVPFISYAVIKGGVGSFVHLAGSLMGPTQHAANSAASEQSTGNYSYGNASYGGLQYENHSSLQQNYAPNHNSGYSSMNDGMFSTKHLDDGGMIMNQTASTLSDKMSIGKSIQSSFQAQHSKAHSETQSAAESYQENTSKASNKLNDLITHQSHSESKGTSYENSDSYDTSTAAGTVRSISKSFGEKFGISERQGMDALSSLRAGGGFNPNICGLSAGIDKQLTNSSGESFSVDEVVDAAKQAASSEDFRESYNELHHAAMKGNASSGDDKGDRLSESYQVAHNKMKSAQKSYTESRSNEKRASEQLNYSENFSRDSNSDQTQRFVEFGVKELGSQSEFQDLMSGSSSTKEQDQQREQLLSSFIDKSAEDDQRKEVDPSFRRLKRMENLKRADPELAKEFSGLMPKELREPGWDFYKGDESKDSMQSKETTPSLKDNLDSFKESGVLNPSEGFESKESLTNSYNTASTDPTGNGFKVKKSSEIMEGFENKRTENLKQFEGSKESINLTSGFPTDSVDIPSNKVAVSNDNPIGSTSLDTLENPISGMTVPSGDSLNTTPKDPNISRIDPSSLASRFEAKKKEFNEFKESHVHPGGVLDTAGNLLKKGANMIPVERKNPSYLEASPKNSKRPYEIPPKNQNNHKN